MATVVPECPICLDRFRDPVVTPCGHLSCGACMGTHVRTSRDPYEATCPTCRAPFPIVTPDMTLIPKKYHVFISPSLRRVYLGDTSRALIDSLNREVTLLKARVGTLKRDKDLLMDRCEAAQSAVSRLTSDERTARLELIKAKEEVRQANVSFERLKVSYRHLESTHLDCLPDTKRKSGQAALDSSTSIDSPSPSPRKAKGFSSGRPVKPMPKRARLQPTTTATAGPAAQKPPALTSLRFADADVVRSSSFSSSSSSCSPSPSPSASASTYAALATNRPSAFTRSGPSTAMARRSHVVLHATSSDEDESDGRGDVDDLIPHYHYHTRSKAVFRHYAGPRLRLERSTPS